MDDLFLHSMMLVRDRYIKMLKVDFANDSYIPICLEDGEATNSKALTEWLDNFIRSGRIHPNDIDKFKTFVSQLSEWVANNDKPTYCTYRREAGDNFKYVFICVVRALDYTETNQTAFLYVKDVDEIYRQEYERALEEIASIDPFTALPNKKAYNKDIAQHKGENVGVIYTDLNCLKHTNDTKGHDEGDRLILDFVTLLTSAFPDYKTYHLCGDEFVVIGYDVPLGSFLQRAMGWHRWLWRTPNEYPLASVGYSLETNSQDIERLVKVAEKAMYVDKNIFYDKYPQFKR